MNSYIDTKLVTLNSKYAVKNNSTYNSNVYFNYSGLLKDEHDIIQADIILLNAQIPVSFYNLNDTCNILNFTINSVNETIVLANGNYNSTTFIAQLKSSFSSLGYSITIVLNSYTGILTITSSTSITFNYSGSTMFRILGFSDTTNYTGTTIICPYPLNLTTIQQLIISSSILSTNTNILYTISVDKPPFSILIFNNSNNITNNILRNKALDSIDIQIKDEYGNYINFNNQNWTLTICLNILRKYNNIEKYMMTDVLKTQPLAISANENQNTDKQDVKDPELTLLSS